MRHALSLAALAIPLVFAANAVAAHDFSWHVGLGLAAELDERVFSTPGARVEAEEAVTAFVAATHGNGFGAELAYVDLGTVSEAGIADAGYELDGELWSLGLTYAVQMDAFEPYAKLGWYSREEDGVALTIAGPRPFDLDDDGLMGEVGLRWRVTEPVALRLGYVWYDFQPDSDASAQFAAEWRF